MRGGSNLTMGMPNPASQGDQRPSKLQMMREDYHKKILREKEQKMVQLYEDSQMSQKKAMMRIMRGGSGEGNNMNGNQPAAGGSVRDFFNERRRMEASGVPVPPIDDHFRQTKGYSSPGGWSSRTGSGNSAKKCSAGRDRSQPLAPIRRPTDTRDAGRTGGNTPRGEKNAGGVQNESNPFNTRPKLVKHKPLPPAANGYNGHPPSPQHQQYQQSNTDRNNNDKPPMAATQSKFGYQGLHQQRQIQQQRQQQQQQQQYQNQHQQHEDQLPPQHTTPKRQQQPQYQRQQQLQQHHQRQQRQQQLQQQQQQQPQRAPAKANIGGAAQTPKSRANQQPKMTDFQKWQMEQNKAREDRLKKFNEHKNQNTKPSGYWDAEEDDEEEEEEEEDNNANNFEEEEEDNEADDDDNNDEVKRLERELLEKIEREKEELDRLRQERTMAEVEEKREIEENKKREMLERARQKKLEEQRRKEEEQRRREEEEDERRERQREERDRKEEEKRRREEEKQRKEEEKLAAKREKEEQRQLAKLQKQQVKDSARSSKGPSGYQEYDDTPINSSRRPPDPDSARLTMGDIDERPAVSNADASFYDKVARSSDAKGPVVSLSKCKLCGRSFAVDRLKKHQAACSKANKPRKEFDSSKKRVEGTEAAQYLGKSKKDPPKKKNNWRAKHEEFINSLRYAKKAAQYEKEGKDLRALTPPPTKENPDYVSCPYCNRSFNESAAQRHIPRCKDLKTKPAPMNTRRR